MRKLFPALLGLLLLCLPARAQFGSFTDVPVEIRADGETRFVDGVAVAEDNVQIHFRGTDIYCDYAEYNPETREVLLVGNIRIYNDQQILNGQRAVYNMETRQIRALDMEGGDQVYKFSTLSMRAPTLKQFRARSLSLTTSDSSEPDYHVRAKSARIYPDDRAILSNATLYVGETPVFWFPYLYAPLGEAGWEIKPGFNSTWGAFLLLGYRFPLSSKTDATARFDYRSERGVGIGIDIDSVYGPKDKSDAKFRAYYASDSNPTENDTAYTRTDEPSSDRWIISFQNRLVVNDDVYATADINAVSDQYFLQDYFPSEFVADPQPDNNVSGNWLTENVQFNILARWQMNDWQEVTSRLPEFTWTAKQAPLFGLPVFYDGQTRLGYLERQFPDGAQPDYITQLQDTVYNPSLFSGLSADSTQDLEAYSAVRFDTFHQISYPGTYFGWLSLTPRVGFRGTYYSRTGNSQEVALGGDYGGATFRPIFNAGFEASFKLSKRYEDIQSTFLGLDGVMHVTQPYANYSYVANMGLGADDILQFDRLVPSTILPSLNFPQFTAIDSIDTSNILRLGVRNRLLTRRDNETFEWLTLDTFVDVNFDNPYLDDPGALSNVYNMANFSPVPWFNFGMLTQFPVSDGDGSFTDANTFMRWQPIRDLSFVLSQRYISGNPFFQDDSQATGSVFWRINDNWAASAAGVYDFTYDTWYVQRYMLHRDLSSWLVSAGFLVTDNRATFGNQTSGQVGVGVLLMLTLKDAPQVNLPLAFDAIGTQQNQQNY
ncbi:MAG: LPS-assembly protein LptD [Chthoniobacterales bacterium]|nr:LPS-assembly protein LptD [Chthoniobacterales bacterium]